MAQHFQIGIIAEVVMDIEYVIQIIIEALLKKDELFLYAGIPACGVGCPQLVSECYEKQSRRKLRRKNRIGSISIGCGS